MYEKILQKLKTQRGQTSNVSDRSLEDLAKSLALIVTTDEILEKADLSAAIVSIDGNINHYTAGAVKNAKALETAAGVAATKKEAEELAAKAKVEADSKGEATPAWATAIIKQNEALTERLNAFQKDKITSTRSEQLKASLKGLPDFYTKPLVDSFANTSFEDDEKFDVYLTGIKTNSEAFKLAATESGMNTSFPSKDVKTLDKTGETATLASAREMVAKENEKQSKSN